ncbi:MAG: biotin/lipoyl-binding protein [Acutalibacteraceae bacterium]|nr:biotin/lipoyl-binding protein [Acutalibacteraceae bacterium]
MKKKLIIIGVILAVLVIAFVAVMFFLPVLSGTEAGIDTVPVTKIADMTGSDSAFNGNRYSGVIEMGEVVTVKADSDKLVKTTYVKEGDTVKAGDKLFEYDVDQLNLQLAQAQLDLDQSKAEITLYNNQITALEREKSGASSNQLLNIESEILSVQIQQKQAQYNEKNAQDTINKLNKVVKDNVVKSEVNGRVTTVVTADDEYAGHTYITIGTSDEYKVLSYISEENIEAFYEGAKILVRSRLDETETWTGVVDSLDVSSPSSNVAEMSGMGDTNNDTADSKYPVRVKLDNVEGLMVGQHVTIELSAEAKEEASSNVELDEFYICDVQTKPYVWCMGAEQKLEKRFVELGEHNADSMTYKVVSGLTAEDYIAFPEEHLAEGMATMQISMDTEMVEDAELMEGM